MDVIGIGPNITISLFVHMPLIETRGLHYICKIYHITTCRKARFCIWDIQSHLNHQHVIANDINEMNRMDMFRGRKELISQ